MYQNYHYLPHIIIYYRGKRKIKKFLSERKERSGLRKNRWCDIVMAVKILRELLCHKNKRKKEVNLLYFIDIFLLK